MMHNNQTIGVIRGIAIFLVVCGHVIQRSMIPFGEDFFLNPLFKVIYTFHMPLFMFISGYCLFFSKQKRSLKEILHARYLRLFVPFMIWGIFDVIIFFILDFFDGKGLDLMGFPAGVLHNLLIKPSIWFLFSLFVMSALLLFSIKLKERLGYFSFALIYLFLLCIPFQEYGALYYIKWFYPFFLGAYLWHKNESKLKFLYKNKLVLIFSIFGFIILALMWSKNDYIYLHKMSMAGGQYSITFFRLLYQYVAGFFGITALFFLGYYLSKTKVGAMFEAIGQHALDIYLLQRYLVEGLYPRLIEYTQVRFDFDGEIFMFCFVPAISIFLVFACLFITRNVFQKNRILRRFLLGSG